MNKFITLSTTLLFMACGDKSDITTDMVGSYTGSIAEPVVSDSYSITVDAIDGDTISISGPDFTTFEVDVMEVGTSITSLVDDTETTLSYEDGLLDVVHIGIENVTFSGEQGTDTSTDTEDTETEDTDTTEADPTEDSVSDLAAGSFTGMITGPVIDTDYTITLTAVDDATVEVSGADFNSFEIPLVMEGTEISQATNWNDGSFVLSSDSLELYYSPIELSFSGDRN